MTMLDTETPICDDAIRSAVREALGDRPVSWLAAESGVYQSILSEWFAGKRDRQGITTGKLVRIMRVLGLRIAPKSRKR